jgi:putative DNA primase/helicase
LPHKTIGEQKYIHAAANDKAHNPYSVSGTVDEWKQNVGIPCVGNPILMACVCAALAGALLKLTKSDNGGLHLHGDSSTGKTTALSAAGSVWGSRQFKNTWRATDNGIEAQTAMHNDNFLVLDEISEAKADAISKITYMLGNGEPKTRMTKEGHTNVKPPFRLLWLSSGERSITEIGKEHGDKVNAGQEIRLVNVPIKQGTGVFDQLPKGKSAAEMADSLRLATQRYYGAVGEAWITELIAIMQEEPSQIAEGFEELLEHITEQVSDLNLNGQETRVLRFFTLLALAGEYATAMGLTGWEEVDVTEAMIEVFKRWRSDNGMNGKQSLESAQIIQDVTDFIQKHEHSRFAPLDTTINTRTISNCAGRIKTRGNGVKEYLFMRVGLEEATKGRDLKKVCKILENAKMLRGDKRGYTKSHTVDGGVSKRFYTIILPPENAKSTTIDDLF